MSKLKEAIIKAILKKVATDIKLATTVAKQSAENATPVVTGWTKAHWVIIIDGVTYDEVPGNEEIFKKATTIQIAHKAAHTGQLNEKYGIISITSSQVDYLLTQLGYKK